jgi:hypothetical protein
LAWAVRRTKKRQLALKLFQTIKPNQKSHANIAKSEEHSTIRSHACAKLFELAEAPGQEISKKATEINVQAVINAPGSRHHRRGRKKGKAPTKNHWIGIAMQRSPETIAAARADSRFVCGCSLPARDHDAGQGFVQPVTAHAGRFAAWTIRSSEEMEESTNPP